MTYPQQARTFPEPTEEEITRPYQKIFTLVNVRYFGGELPPIEIIYPEAPSISHKDRKELRKRNALGCFLYDPARRLPPLICLGIKKDIRAGVTIEDINTLYHEMIHYYCYLHGIEDIYRYDRDYHTFDFKRAVEAHGGECGYCGIIKGYADAHLPAGELWEIWEAF